MKFQLPVLFNWIFIFYWGKECACNAGDLGSTARLGNLLEKGMATHSSNLAWRIPWTEESGGLQSMGSQRVGHHWATNISTFIVDLQCCIFFKYTTKLFSYTYAHFFSRFFSRVSHYRALNRIPCAIIRALLFCLCGLMDIIYLKGTQKHE